MPREQPLILLVEEDPLIADITGFRLELLGYRVAVVPSGEEALQAVEQECPNAIVLGMTLPGLGGLEVTARLRNDERTSKIPIIAFSISADLEDVQRAFAAGADEYVVKPYDPNVLEQKIEQLLA